MRVVWLLVLVLGTCVIVAVGNVQAWLRVSEFMASPKDATDAEQGRRLDGFEYVELHNTGDAELSLKDVSLADGVVYTFPPGAPSASEAPSSLRGRRYDRCGRLRGRGGESRRLCLPLRRNNTLWSVQREPLQGRRGAHAPPCRRRCALLPLRRVVRTWRGVPRSPSQRAGFQRSPSAASRT